MNKRRFSHIQVLMKDFVKKKKSFFVELGYAKPKASEVLQGLFVPQLKGDGATGLAISLLGAMVMPHNLFLHSALVLSRKVPRSVQGIKNVLGNWSSKLFAIALLASGQSSTITGTYAGQYVMQGFLDLRIRPWLRNLLTRSLAIIPSLIVAIIGGSSGAGKLLIIASMFLSFELPFALVPLLNFTSSKKKMGSHANSTVMILSFELPFALVPLLKFTSSKKKMGSHANSTVISAITWIIGSLIMSVNMYYIVTSFVKKLLLHSGLRTISIVFAGIFGFSGMLVYLAAIVYLVVRKTKKVIQPLLSDSDGIVLGSNCSGAEIGSLPREDI